MVLDSMVLEGGMKACPYSKLFMYLKPADAVLVKMVRYFKYTQERWTLCSSLKQVLVIDFNYWV